MSTHNQWIPGLIPNPLYIFYLHIYYVYKKMIEELKVEYHYGKKVYM